MGRRVIELWGVADEVLAEAIVMGGHRLVMAAVGLARPKRSKQAAAESFFASYSTSLSLGNETQLAERLPGDLQSSMADILNMPSTRAVIHELFAVRVSGMGSQEVDRLRQNFCNIVASSPTEDISIDPTELAVCVEDIFEHFDTRIASVIEEFGRVHPDLLRDARQDTQLTQINATVTAIARHTAALAGVSDPGADQQFLERYRRQVLDYHGKLEPPDFERRRRVPIGEIFVSPTFIAAPSIAEMDAQHEPEDLDISQLAHLIDRTVLLGDPGGGKTTVCHVLIHMQASKPRDRIPFFVTLREFAVEDPPSRSVVGHIEHKLDTFYSCAPAAGLVERLLLSGMALVIFDGLDELVDVGRRADVAAIVERFCTEYPLAAVVVSSRVIGYEQARLDESQFTCFRIRGFNEAGVAEYASKWFAREEGMTRDEQQRSAADFLSDSSAVADLRAYPLMLSLMCILYRGEGSIPQNRPEIYAQCASLFFRRWDARRRISTDLRARAMIEPVLQYLTYWLLTKKAAEPIFTEQELVSQTTEFLLSRGFERRDEAAIAARELIEFCRGRAWVFSDVGVTDRRESLYAFTHRTFMEFFAATYLASLYDSPTQLARRLAPRIARREWEVIAQLAVQIKDHTAARGAERIYKVLLADQRRSEDGRENTLAFLGQCLSFTQPPTRMVRELAREAIDFAFRPNPYRSTRLSSLGSVMYGCGAYFEVIGEEISAAIADRISQGDVATRSYTLKLAISLGDLPWLSHGPEDRLRSSRSWDDFGERLTLTYLEDIVELAYHDITLATEALLRQRIDIGQFLNWHGPDLTNLIRSIPHLQYRPSAESWSYYRYRPLASELLGARPGDKYDDATWWPWITHQLQRLGRTMEAYPDPPWVKSTAEDMDMSCMRYFSELPESQLELVHDTAAVAMGVLLFTCAEVEIEIEALIGLAASTAYLIPYSSYLKKRAGHEVELAPLHVGERFANLFNAWANREIDFTYG